MSEQDETVIDLGGGSTSGSSTSAPTTMSDTLAQGPEPRTSRRPLAAYIAAGLVLVILAGVGAVVWWRMRFAGPQPAESLPDSLAAYVSVDLAPSPGQQARLLALADKLPQIGKLAGRDTLSPAKIFEALTGPSSAINFSRDIEPWLGVRAGVGMWATGRDKLYAVIAAASTDDGAARAGLTRLRDSLKPVGKLGFVVENRVALIVVGDDDAQAAAQAARAEATAHPFSESPRFQQARQWLGGDQVVVVWVDNGRYAELIGQRFMPGMGLGGPPPTGRAEGAFVLGITATGQGLEARFRSFGSAAAPPVPDALAKLGALPANSTIAAIARIPDNAFNPTGPLVAEPASILAGMYFFGLGWALAGGDIGMPGGPPPGELTPAEQREVDALMSKDPDALTDAEKARLKELIGFDPSGMPGPGKELTKAEQQELEALLSKDPSALTAAESARLAELAGFDPNVPGMPLPTGVNPLEDLSGATVTVAVSSLLTQPAFRAVLEMASAEKASHFAANAGRDLSFSLTVDGRTVTGVTPGYTADAGRLADQPEFQRAVTGAPSGLSTAAYVDLRRAVPPARSAELSRLSAIALLVGADGGDQAGLVRLIVT